MPERNRISISPKIGATLRNLRRKIRSYVLLEGFSVAAIWIAGTFLFAFALDYLPVRFGLSELSIATRAIILILTAGVLGWLLYRLVVLRTAVKLSDSSLALLIERQNPELSDSLTTSVQALTRVATGEADRDLYRMTQDRAEKGLANVQLRQVLNRARLHRLMAIAGAMLVGVVSFAVLAWPTFSFASQRIYLLDSARWPRSHFVEVIGIRVKRDVPIEGIKEFGQIVKPESHEFKVAQGSSVTLLINASADLSDLSNSIPDFCELRYWSGDGNQGRQRFKRIGLPRDGKQLFSLDGVPLEGIISDVSFQVRGGDFRSDTFRIKVVEPPAVYRTDLECVFPKYMVDEDSMRFTPRTIPWTRGVDLPLGTQVSIRTESNKPLTKVYVLNRQQNEMLEIAGDEKGFVLGLPELETDLDLDFYLCDVDGIISEKPHSVSVKAIQDKGPQVQAFLEGIGTAITPDAIVPIRGNIKDDYDVQNTWVEIDRREMPTTRRPFSLQKHGALKTNVDFRAYRQDPNGFSIQPGEFSQISLTVKANDHYDRGGEPNVGAGDVYTLDIVSPSELLKILERLEVGQRRRLEQIFEEMSDAREYLVRAKANQDATRNEGAEPGDAVFSPEKEVSDADEQLKQNELRLLFAQRAILQADKSRGEMSGVADAFRNIRMQLVNNRVDSESRKRRLQVQVIEPLNLITAELMQQLNQSMLELEEGLASIQDRTVELGLLMQVEQQAVVAIQEMDVVLAKIDSVLAVLIKYETQNELLDLVRQMIKKQNEIMQRTKKERERNAFEGLLD